MVYPVVYFVAYSGETVQLTRHSSKENDQEVISVLRGSPPTLPLFLLLSSQASSPGIDSVFSVLSQYFPVEMVVFPQIICLESNSRCNLVAQQPIYTFIFFPFAWMKRKVISECLETASFLF